MYRTAGITFIDCDYNKQQPYTVYCWCCPKVYKCICNTMSMDNFAHCYTQCDIKTTNYPTLNTLYRNHPQLCTTFICAKEHWKLIYLPTVYSPLTANIPTAVADPPTHWLLFSTQTAQHLCHHHVSSSSLCCCCTEHFNIIKSFCFN